MASGSEQEMSGWSDLLHSSSKLLEQAAPSAQFPPLQVLLLFTFFIHFHRQMLSTLFFNCALMIYFIAEEFRSIGSIVEEVEG